ncbi:alkaline phosphatase family protein [Haloarculaceae archaeon H-GB11]|nr:alkaline phosphatase family protein [Haloarculaceae archaeon H-GB11]
MNDGTDHTSGDSTGMQTLLLGLDAACDTVLEPVFDRGVAPTLESLLADAETAPLTSQMPPWTPSAWPSLYTGVNPGKHGSFGFLTFDGYDYDVVDATEVRELALWELLDEHDKSSVVVNVPVTHPPGEFDGALIPGYVAPEDPPCHPDGILDDVEDEIGDYRVYAPPHDELTDDEREQWYRRLTHMRGETFRYLADRFDPEFGFLQFQQIDTVFHEYPGDWDTAASVYEAVDEEVRKTLESCDPDTVVVASDHGMGEYTGVEFRVNDYLADHGFVTSTAGEGGMPSWSTIARNRHFNGDDEETTDDGPDLLQRGLSLAAKVGLTSQRIGAVLEAAGLKEFVLDRVSVDAVRAASEQVDFPASTAFMRSRVECGVRLNVEGRDPNGVVPAAERDRVRDEVIESLRAATTPAGDPIFEEVAPREAYFDGPYVEEAADILVVPTAWDHYLSAQYHEEPFDDPSPCFNHKRDGIVALGGDAVDRSATLDRAHLYDVAPTVLATLGVPVSDRMDGERLPLVPDVPEREYPEYDGEQDGMDTTDAVEDQLSHLGYIE